jgi:hypothetical protein
MSADTTSKCAIILRSADQYLMWKARVGDLCWSATGMDIFDVTDDQCKTLMRVLADQAGEKKTKDKWLSKCWDIVTTSIHDDVYRKVHHVSRGLLQSLLTEIAHALVVNNLEEVPALRLELYSSTMAKDAGSELQAWISYIMERADKLEFLKKPVEESELIAIFLKGLVPTFNQLQVAFAIPGSSPKKFADAIATTRKFAANPTVAADLAKLKSRGQSQSMFLTTTTVPQAPRTKSQILCRAFCRYRPLSLWT